MSPITGWTRVKDGLRSLQTAYFQGRGTVAAAAVSVLLCARLYLA